MSHFTTIETQIRDIEALKAACAEMGLTLAQDCQARGYGGKTHQGEYVIVLKGPYDIALNRQVNGAFRLTTDWYQDHVEKQVGKNFGRLLQFYGVHKATLEARRKGYTVTRGALNSGAIKLTIAGGSLS
jgi:hypothetical protein